MLDSCFTSLYTDFRAQAREDDEVGIAKGFGKIQLLRTVLKFQLLKPEMKGKDTREVREMRELARAAYATGNRSLCAIQMIGTDGQGCVKNNQA